MQWWKYKYATFWRSFVRRGMLPPGNRAAIFREEGLVLWGFLWDMLTHFSATRKEIYPVDSIETNKIFISFFTIIILAWKRAHFQAAADEPLTSAGRPSFRRLVFKWSIKAEWRWGDETLMRPPRDRPSPLRSSERLWEFSGSVITME